MSGNWDCGRAIPCLGMSVSYFQYWFFAEYPVSVMLLLKAFSDSIQANIFI